MTVVRNCLMKAVFKRALLASNTGANLFSTSSNYRKVFTLQDLSEFNETVLKSELPVVVDFKASWCGPCKMLEPRLETVVAKNADKVHLVKVDIDTFQDLAMEYEVESVPCVIGFKNGKVQKNFIGLQDEDKIESFVNELIGS
ncbi:thioredoxin, mitochondrial [Parasteatoda tepidariorum]|uniref:thioredoxin, mitochondrial n=1 Tax=Parasteatoda tepidariorum TaxID=114398 RepID=UPI00077FABEF|nr:thioredoxin, mitochondrial [Parasteatoda tepidariorum]